MIESIDSKSISVCLINDYLFIADLHIFVYGSAECASISLECTKVKLLISNNFDNYLQTIHFLVGAHILRQTTRDLGVLQASGPMETFSQTNGMTVTNQVRYLD